MLSKPKEKLTSEQIAKSINTNASFVRKVIGMLVSSNLIQKEKGSFNFNIHKLKIKPSVDTVFDFININSALDKVAKGNSKVKTIIKFS
ncbi:Transcriptional regulator [Mycoplasmopsis glycophila]|uniref:Transcriptional regulator n=2 Tax=Mycoplasmopsis glycophila TaxID=171285 RepID=A0A449AV24_9BACT|nr:Transcriptional regulator [Mycoplasmopsis glycophila]